MSGRGASPHVLADVSQASERRPGELDDPTRRVWLSVGGVQSRTGRGRRRVVEALARGLARRERGEPPRPDDLRGYQSGPGGVWAVHVDDADAWMRGEVPAPVRGVA